MATVRIDDPATWYATSVNPTWEYGSSYKLRCALKYRHGFRFGVNNNMRYTLHVQIRSLLRGLALARLSWQLYGDPDAVNHLPIQPSYRVRQ